MTSALAPSTAPATAVADQKPVEGVKPEAEKQEESPGFFTNYIVQPGKSVGAFLWKCCTAVWEAVKWVFRTITCGLCCAVEEKKDEVSGFETHEVDVDNAKEYLFGRSEPVEKRKGMLKKTVTTTAGTLKAGDIARFTKVDGILTELTPETKNGHPTQVEVKGHLKRFEPVKAEGSDEVKYPECLQNLHESFKKLDEENRNAIIALMQGSVTFSSESDKGCFSRELMSDEALFTTHLETLRWAIGQFFINKMETVKAEKAKSAGGVPVAASA